MAHFYTLFNRLFLIFVFAFISLSAFAQKGSISGRIIDGTSNKPMDFVSVMVLQDGLVKGGNYTENDGSFIVKPLDPSSSYTLIVTNIGYDTIKQTSILVSADKETRLGDLKLNKPSAGGTVLKTATVVYVRPPIDQDHTSTGGVKTKEEIRQMAVRGVSDVAAATTGGLYQKDGGKGIQVKGGRENATRVIVDGIPQRGGINIPQSAFEQVEVITGGIPAKYGDAIGGIINVTTRGASKKFSGSGELATSKFLDPYGYYLASINLNGPLLFNTKDPNAKNRKPLVGYNLSIEWQHDKDANPSAVGMWRVKDSVLSKIQQNPLLTNPQTGFGYVRSADTVTYSSMEKIKYKQNAASDQLSVAGKLDFNINSGMYLAIGGNFSYNKNHQYIREYAMFNSENNPQNRNNSWRVFVRMTQRLGQRVDPNLSAQENAKKNTSVIQNAFYTIQFDFSEDNTLRWDDTHKKNIFDYGYVGKFETRTAKTYIDSFSLLTNQRYKIQGLDRDTLVVFTPGTANVNMSNYTTQYFNEVGDERSNIFNRNLDQALAFGAMLNGRRPGDVNSLWYNTGRQYPSLDYSQNRQIRMSVDGSLDLKVPGAKKPHAIEFGLVYEQRVDRAYSVGASGLWTQMRLLANRQLASLDKANPHFVSVNGVFQDTINYDRLYIKKDQSTFDRNLRAKLNLAADSKDIIDIDALDPNTFSLGMFSPDELLNNGNNLVSYRGYKYTGEKLRGNPSFNDFFTKKTNDVYNREIGANRPIYNSVYLQDRFSFRDLIFNIGVRVDRYDANTKVLKDPYSLYAIRSKGDVDGILNNANGGLHPSNITDEYAVYVDDFTNPKAANILGYRNGDRWYDAKGVEITDPNVLAKQSSTNSIQPFLVNSKDKITDSLFDPTTAFKDYVPQITVMPRIAFSFPINDGDALFFAHYDVLAQRPQSRNFITPDDYLYFENIVTDGTLNNPNLKPEKTIDYQLGYEQKLSPTAALKLSAFYREYKDMVQVMRVTQAYPKSYRTYGNRDFATVKGFEIGYDQQKSQNIRFNVNYTLSFADGTGSDDRSQANLINDGQPNLRTILPLSYDVRHTFGGNIDFRYTEGKNYNGPTVWGKQIFANAGVNLTARARSGEPYTRQGSVRNEALISPTGTIVLVGSINGSRLPWNYKFDLRIDKNFMISTKSKTEGKAKKEYALNAYLTIQNLLNTMNIQSVYSYTGNASDDGYLGSPTAVANVAAQTYPQAFIDQYQIKVNNPDNYSLPRRIRLGVVFNF
jgi:outer membrane receptor protein involved in Fe transport